MVGGNIILFWIGFNFKITFFSTLYIQFLSKFKSFEPLDLTWKVNLLNLWRGRRICFTILKKILFDKSKSPIWLFFKLHLKLSPIHFFSKILHALVHNYKDDIVDLMELLMQNFDGFKMILKCILYIAHYL